ncbi:MAG: beta-hydroxyacyl-ACP dehydratase [Planctomycetes bacterium]|nr:beta-hydroxyacyl-ACP dehydratase [Planctomycetota bacterium]
MPSTLLTDIGTIDVNNVALDKEKIRSLIPHRYEMEQIDAVLKFDKDNRLIVGLKNVRADEFWVRGHIPGRPLLPGVLMVEASAQLASVFSRLMGISPGDKFIGFSGIDKVKFRGTVIPGDKLIIIIKCTDMNNRRAFFETQGIVNNKLVFEGTITGMII